MLAGKNSCFSTIFLAAILICNVYISSAASGLRGITCFEEHDVCGARIAVCRDYGSDNRISWNSSEQRCVEVTAHQCGKSAYAINSPNRFDTVEACMKTCAPQTVCSQPNPVSLSRLPVEYPVRYTFDTAAGECIEFEYSPGAQAFQESLNQFETKEACQETCVHRW